MVDDFGHHFKSQFDSTSTSTSTSSMSSLEAQRSARKRLQGSSTTPSHNMAADSASLHARSSSLQRHQASTRSPRPANGHHYALEQEDGVELTLLSDQEQRQAALGVDSEEVREKLKAPLSKKDKQAIVLLIILCTPVSTNFYNARADLDLFSRPYSGRSSM